jgi:hypothetical protein
VTTIPNSHSGTESRGPLASVLLYSLRLAGAALILLVVFPAYRLLDSPDAGPFVRDAIASADLSRTMLFLGTLILSVVGVLATRIVEPATVASGFARLGSRLAAIPTVWFAGGLALLSAFLTLAFSLVVLHGKPNLIDAMVQLLHARFLAAGQLAGPVDRFSEFWLIQNSLVTPHGWVSQYPPGYVVLLAAGLRLGVVQAVGPFLAGLTVFFTALAAERLLRDDVVPARLGAVMLALSPFVIGLAAAYMNHIAAAAFTSAAVYFAVRGRDSDNPWWSVFAGLAVGGVFSIRPLSAFVAALLVAAVWLTWTSDRWQKVLLRVIRYSAFALIGIAPVLVALGAYNQHFFGNPFRFGYLAAQGPLVLPGFHWNPVGEFYGPLQALAFTSSDLVALSLYLLESPIPAVVVVGLFLLFARRLSPGEYVIALWALLPVVANAFYWHHGVFMGPRMLNEAAPAWALLTAIAGVGLVRLIPGKRLVGNYSPRAAIAITLALGWCVGIVYLGPQRLASYGGGWMESSRLEVPRASRPLLVFVHGAWSGRIAARLTASGLRVDSLETVLRQNTTCDAQRFADWYAKDPAHRAAERPSTDLNFVRHDKPPFVLIANGDKIRAYPGVPMSRACLREVASDTLGIVDVGPLLWQSDLFGLAGVGTMVARDMGPEANASLMQRFPERLPIIIYRSEKEGEPRLAPYVEGMSALWH